MTVKEYLQQNPCPVNHSVVAALMWPENKYAKTYLSKKLRDADGRIWNDDDSEKALNALKTLAIDIKKLKKG